MIEAKSLEVLYQKDGKAFRALGPLDFEVIAGELVCILGQSGCGKSTLLRALAGLVQISKRHHQTLRGEIRFQGEPVICPSYQRSVVFQRPALLPWLSVRQNVELGFRIRGQQIPQQTVDTILKLVGLAKDEHSKPGSLSGGMAQRAEIARSLVATPPLLLMDEPFSALDPETREELQNELRRIWKERELTIVFVTHDIDEAVSLATRIMVMTPRGLIGRTFQIPQTISRDRHAAETFRLRTMVKEEMQLLKTIDRQGASSQATTSSIP